MELNLSDLIGPKGFKIEVSEAKGSYAKDGSGIAKGDEISRLVLGGDTRFHVAVAAKNEVNFLQKIFTHVKINEGGKTLYVNVNSVAKRLHLSKSKISDAAKKGELTSLIQNRSVEVTKILNNYERLVAPFTTSNPNLNPKILMKVISKAVPLFPEQASKQSDLEIKKKGHTFVVSPDADGKMNLSFVGKVLGKGSFGTVHLVTHLDGTSPLEIVIKYAEDADSAREDVKNELAMLNYLHGTEKMEGIQDEPHRLVNILGQGKVAAKEGYLAPLYEGALTKAFQEPIEQKLQRGRSILAGLATLSAKNVAHKDIKPANILIRGGETVIGDFGGAKRMDIRDDKPVRNVHTPAYTNLDLASQAEDLWGDHYYDMAASLMNKNDIFSTGVTLYQLFVGSEDDYPYGFQSDGYPLIDSNSESWARESLLEAGVPKETVEVVINMIFNPQLQESSDVFAAYDKLHPKN